MPLTVLPAVTQTVLRRVIRQFLVDCKCDVELAGDLSFFRSNAKFN